MRLILAMLLTITCLTLGACNTMEGAGRDLENAGESVQDAAE